jgi:hypothetical protein
MDGCSAAGEQGVGDKREKGRERGACSAGAIIKQWIAKWFGCMHGWTQCPHVSLSPHSSHSIVPSSFVGRARPPGLPVSDLSKGERMEVVLVVKRESKKLTRRRASCSGTKGREVERERERGRGRPGLVQDLCPLQCPAVLALVVPCSASASAPCVCVCVAVPVCASLSSPLSLWHSLSPPLWHCSRGPRGGRGLASSCCTHCAAPLRVTATSNWAFTCMHGGLSDPCRWEWEVARAPDASLALEFGPPPCTVRHSSRYDPAYNVRVLWCSIKWTLAV